MCIRDRILTGQLKLLQDGNLPKKFIENVEKIAAELESLEHIIQGKDVIDLIYELQTGVYWQNVTVPMLEVVRRKLRKLVKLIESKKRKTVYTDFTDEIGEATELDIPDVKGGVDKAAFRRKVEHFLKEHEDHITILKLKRAEQLTEQDIEELNKLFAAEGLEDQEALEELSSGKGGLGLFIRSVVGMSREAVQAALADFVSDKTSNQITFVEKVIAELCSNVVIDPARLYESPYTDTNELGVAGIFDDADVTDFIHILDDITRRAAACTSSSPILACRTTKGAIA